MWNSHNKTIVAKFKSLQKKNCTKILEHENLCTKLNALLFNCFGFTAEAMNPKHNHLFNIVFNSVN